MRRGTTRRADTQAPYRTDRRDPCRGRRASRTTGARSLNGDAPPGNTGSGGDRRADRFQLARAQIEMGPRFELDLDGQGGRHDAAETKWSAVPSVTDLAQRQSHSDTLCTTDFPGFHAPPLSD